jgi:glyoxylase-like metal-dependent hydrolase (beta-lactamase superfamily II)
VKVGAFVTGPFEENCYLVIDDASNEAVLVDPGADGERLVEAVRRAGVQLRGIWLTHAHLDHIGAVAEVKRAFDVPVRLHPADLPLYRAGARQAQAYGVPFEQPFDPDEWFDEGSTARVGSLEFAVMHAPGHAPGHVVLHTEGLALVGDCLFAGSVGRTDLPLSDGAEFARSLARIAALPPGTRVLPGHGPETTIGRELASNPFLMGIARPRR